MWTDKILQSFGEKNYDSCDVYTSKWLYYHEDAYSEFNNRVKKIKDGDLSICFEMCNLFLNCSTERLNVFIDLLLSGPYENVRLLFGELNNLLTEREKQLLHEFKKGKCLFWDLQTEKISLKNQKSTLKETFRLSQNKVRIFYHKSLSLKVRTFIQDKIANSFFIEGIKHIPLANFCFEHIIPSSISSYIEQKVREVTVHLIDNFIDTFTVLFFCEMPNVLKNLQKTFLHNPPDLATCMYIATTRDKGLLQMNTILSHFYTQEAGTEGLYLITATSRLLARYSINNGYTNKIDWEEMVNKLPYEIRYDLGKSILENLTFLINIRTRRPHVAISLEEMFGKPIGMPLVDVVKQFFAEEGTDATEVAIIYQMLCKHGLMADLRGGSNVNSETKQFTKTAFRIAVQYELAINISDTTFAAKCRSLVDVLKSNSTKGLSKNEIILKDKYEEQYNKWHYKISEASED